MHTPSPMRPTRGVRADEASGLVAGLGATRLMVLQPFWHCGILPPCFTWTCIERCTVEVTGLVAFSAACADIVVSLLPRTSQFSRTHAVAAHSYAGARVEALVSAIARSGLIIVSVRRVAE